MKTKDILSLNTPTIIKNDKEEIREQQNYSKLLNAKGTNALATIPTSSRAIKAQFTYHPEIDANSFFTEDDVKVTIKDFNNATQLGNSILFFYYLLCNFTQNISYKENNISNEDLEIYFDVEEYLTARKKEITPDNKKNIMREVKKMYETLKRVSVVFEEYNYKDKEIKRYSLEIFAGKGTTESLIKRSKNYFFILNPLLANYLMERNYITYFPNTAFSIDVMRHPNAISLTNKLSVLYSENFWKSNKGLISLNNLLATVSDIPNFETVSKTNRNYFDRIVEPLERELDYLQNINILSKWEWTNKKREPLSNEQLKSYDYKALSNCYLYYELADYPEQEQIAFKKRKDEKKKTTTARKQKKS